MDHDTHTIEVWGDLACFTRPEMKVERYSYPVITPSAARGVFDAIYWDGRRERVGKQEVVRPYFYWQITRIDVLAMPRFIALRRNEVKDKAPSERTINAWIDGREAPEPIWADAGKDDLGTDQKGRTQRQTMALKNVRYRLSARIVPRTAHRHETAKLSATFERRAKQGKCFQQPYFGCREFPAFFDYVASNAPAASPIALDQHLGWMLYDVFDLADESPSLTTTPFISLFDATVAGGVIRVPEYSSPAVRKPARR